MAGVVVQDRNAKTPTAAQLLKSVTDEELHSLHVAIHRQAALSLAKGEAISDDTTLLHSRVVVEMTDRGLTHTASTALDKAVMTSSSLGTMGGGTGVEAPQQGGGRKRSRRRRRGMYKADLQTKDSVNYHMGSFAKGQFCGNCKYFVGDGNSMSGACELVAGSIQTVGVCDLWCDCNMEGMDAEDMVKLSLPIKTLHTLEKSDPKRFTLSVAYPVDEFDSQGDTANADAVEEAAWFFMSKGGQAGLMHMIGASGEDFGTVVESYIYRNPAPWTVTDVDGYEQVVKQGDWLVGQVWTPKYYDPIQRRVLKGVSIQGVAQREDIPESMIHWLQTG